jgi:DNA mismatch endonuclease (patch repair protein)
MSARPGKTSPKLVVDAATSARLARIRQKNTAPELLVRSMLHRLGLRFRVGRRGLPGSPDIVNVSKRWVVFVHGCFWHAHAGCSRATVPRRNRGFWRSKLDANRVRDARAVRALRRMGYTTIVVWECDVAAKPQLTTRRLRKLLPPR